MGNTKKYAVLTGDIVESSKLSVDQLDKTRKALKNIINEFASLYPDIIVGNIANFRGDGWQLLVANPKYVLRVLLFITCGLKLAQVNNTRIGIATGTVEKIDYENISLSSGEAFTKSGKILNDIENMKVKKDKPFWSLADKNIYKSLTYEILSSIANDWTYAVSQAIYGSLKGTSQQGIADRTGVSRQNVTKNLKSGKWNLLEKFLAEEEKSNH
jgi:hypothetical protein